jgi:hypothetical protein
MMEITRLTELSLFYNMRDYLSVKKTGEVLSSTNLISYTVKYTNVITSIPMVVYKNGAIVINYTIDYVNGIITFNSTLLVGDVVTVDYYYCIFNIYDESSNATTDSFKYPAIAIYEDDTDTAGFELGSATKETTTTWIIEVWAERGGERNDATDNIVKMFNGTIPIVNYNNGFPVNSDKTLNINFNPNDIMTYAICESIKYRKGGSLDIGSKPMYFSEIRADLKIYNI